VSIVILIVTAFGLDLSTNIKSFFVGGSFSILPSLLLIVYLNFPRSGEIIMSMAIADGFLFIVVWLHKIGVSLSNRGLLELTPLETAKHYNHDNIATYIIKHTT
jgi:hypothetical protein